MAAHCFISAPCFLFRTKCEFISTTTETVKNVICGRCVHVKVFVTIFAGVFLRYRNFNNSVYYDFI